MFKISTLALIFSFLLLTGCGQKSDHIDKAVVISANAEWKVIKELYPNEEIQHSPWGEYFIKTIDVAGSSEPILFFHGGWGKVAAAGSTQYCIDTWHPKYIINLGTCGGFEAHSERFDIILVDRTVIYDIVEAMGDSKEAIDDYSTKIDLSWLEGETPSVTKTLLVSADRDIVPGEIPKLINDYHAVAGDWESGAIAYTCSRNNQRLLILRGVTDLVSVEKGGEAYGDAKVFVQGTSKVMKQLVADLPVWLAKCK